MLSYGNITVLYVLFKFHSMGSVTNVMCGGFYDRVLLVFVVQSLGGAVSFVTP